MIYKYILNNDLKKYSKYIKNKITYNCHYQPQSQTEFKKN